MDELARACAELVERPEFAPSPLATIESRARRHRRNRRSAVATTVAFVALVGAFVVSIAAHGDAQSKQGVFVGEPTIAGLPTTSSASSPAIVVDETDFSPRSRTYEAGAFDVDEFSFSDTPFRPVEMTLTPGTVWFSSVEGAHTDLVEFDMARARVTRRLQLGSNLTVEQLTSTRDTVYVLATDPDASATNLYAIRVDHPALLWQRTFAGGPAAMEGQQFRFALGKGSLYVAGGTLADNGSLSEIDLATGRTRWTTPLPHAPNSMAATGSHVWMGWKRGVMRAPAHRPPVAVFTLGRPHRVLAVDDQGAWCVRTRRPSNDLVRLDAGAGHVVAYVAAAADSLAVEGSEGWFTTGTGPAGVIDTATGRLLAAGALESVGGSGPSAMHVLNSEGWAVNGATSQLVRIRRR